MITGEQITATITGEAKITKKVASISAFEICNVLNDQFKLRMDRSRNVDGSLMRPLKPSTILAKRLGGGRFPSKPLIFTGELQRGNAITGNEREAQLAMTAAGKISYSGKPTSATNISVLNAQKSKGRFPWGIGKADFAAIKKYVVGLFK